MGRRRVGVVALIERPAGDEIDGLRRGLGDPALGRIAPHITLVPPLNLASGMLGEALARLRQAAACVAGPLEVGLGPPETFLPANPVLYLAVGGDTGGLRRLRDAVLAPPLTRPITWPWVPHVTLADGIAPERITAALASLQDYRMVTSVDRLVLLEEERVEGSRRWRPIADAVLGPAAVVGRGGLEVVLHPGRMLDPEVMELLAADDAAAALVASAGLDVRLLLSVTARTASGLAGVAGAWQDAAGTHVGVHVAPSARSHGVGRHLLAAVEARLVDAGCDPPVLHAHGAADFYRARSDWARPIER